MFTTACYAAGIFLDANNYRLTKSIVNFRLIFLYAKGTISSFILKLFKCNSFITYIQKFGNQCKIKWKKKIWEKKNEGE